MCQKSRWKGPWLMLQKVSVALTVGRHYLTRICDGSSKSRQAHLSKSFNYVKVVNLGNLKKCMPFWFSSKWIHRLPRNVEQSTMISVIVSTWWMKLDSFAIMVTEYRWPRGHSTNQTLALLFVHFYRSAFLLRERSSEV